MVQDYIFFWLFCGSWETVCGFSVRLLPGVVEPFFSSSAFSMVFTTPGKY